MAKKVDSPCDVDLLLHRQEYNVHTYAQGGEMWKPLLPLSVCKHDLIEWKPTNHWCVLLFQIKKLNFIEVE